MQSVLGFSLYETLDKKTILSIGAVNAVIYHFENSKLFHIDKKSAEKILQHKCNLPEGISAVIGNEYSFQKLQLSGEETFELFKVCVDMTDLCNYHCTNCFHKSLSTHQFLNDRVIEAINQIPNAHSIDLCLLGGEPLLYDTKKLMILLNFWTEKFKSVTIFTNGSRIDEQWIDEFKKYSNIKIRITFYSTKSFQHDEYTGVKGAYDKTLLLVKKLIDDNIFVKLNVVLTTEEADFYKNNPNEIKELGCPVFIDIRRPAISCNYSDEDIQLIEERKNQSSEKYKPLMKSNYNDVKRHLIYHSCYFGKIFIGLSGDIYRCIWNQNEKSLNICDIDWESGDLGSDLNWKEPIHNKYSQCNLCEFAVLCFDCTALNSASEQTNLGKPFLCKYNPLKGTYNV